MTITEVVAIAGLILLLIGNIATMIISHDRSNKAQGQLEQKVETLKETIDGSSQRVGLIEKVDGISRHLASLESECHTIFPIITAKLDKINGKREKSDS